MPLPSLSFYSFKSHVNDIARRLSELSCLCSPFWDPTKFWEFGHIHQELHSSHKLENSYKFGVQQQHFHRWTHCPDLSSEFVRGENSRKKYIPKFQKLLSRLEFPTLEYACHNHFIYLKALRFYTRSICASAWLLSSWKCCVCQSRKM